MPPITFLCLQGFTRVALHFVPFYFVPFNFVPVHFVPFISSRSFRPVHFVPSYISSPVISSPVISPPWSFRPLELNLQRKPRKRDLFKMYNFLCTFSRSCCRLPIIGQMTNNGLSYDNGDMWDTCIKCCTCVTVNKFEYNEMRPQAVLNVILNSDNFLRCKFTVGATSCLICKTDKIHILRLFCGI
jgi:hypothetical protein